MKMGDVGRHPVRDEYADVRRPQVALLCDTIKMRDVRRLSFLLFQSNAGNLIRLIRAEIFQHLWNRPESATNDIMHYLALCGFSKKYEKIIYHKN